MASFSLQSYSASGSSSRQDDSTSRTGAAEQEIGPDGGLLVALVLATQVVGLPIVRGQG